MFVGLASSNKCIINLWGCDEHIVVCGYCVLYYNVTQTANVRCSIAFQTFINFSIHCLSVDRISSTHIECRDVFTFVSSIRKHQMTDSPITFYQHRTQHALEIKCNLISSFVTNRMNEQYNWFHEPYTIELYLQSKQAEQQRQQQ